MTHAQNNFIPWALEQARQVGRRIEETRPRVRMLSRLVCTAGRLGLPDVAHALFHEARNSVEALEDEKERRLEIAGMIAAFAEEGDLERAFELAQHSDLASYNVGLLGVALVQRGRLEEAAQMAASLLPADDNPAIGYTKTDLQGAQLDIFLALAQAQANAGQTDEVERLANLSLDLVQPACRGGPDQKAIRFSAVGKIWSQIGQPKKSMQCFRKAIQAARPGRYDLNRSNAFWEICDALLKADLPDTEKKRLLAFAEEAAPLKPANSWYPAPGLESVAYAYTQLGEWESGMKLVQQVKFPDELQMRIACAMVASDLIDQAKRLMQQVHEQVAAIEPTDHHTRDIQLLLRCCRCLCLYERRGTGSDYF